MNSQKTIQAFYGSDTTVYRWMLIDNQNTCLYEVVKILDGYWASREDAKAAYEEQNPNVKGIFDECLFTVKEIEFTATPWEVAIS